MVPTTTTSAGHGRHAAGHADPKPRAAHWEHRRCSGAQSRAGTDHPAGAQDALRREGAPHRLCRARACLAHERRGSHGARPERSRPSRRPRRAPGRGAVFGAGPPLPDYPREEGLHPQVRRGAERPEHRPIGGRAWRPDNARVDARPAGRAAEPAPSPARAQAVRRRLQRTEP